MSGTTPTVRSIVEIMAYDCIYSNGETYSGGIRNGGSSDGESYTCNYGGRDVYGGGIGGGSSTAVRKAYFSGIDDLESYRSTFDGVSTDQATHRRYTFVIQSSFPSHAIP